jgi:hypothetical protein
MTFFIGTDLDRCQAALLQRNTNNTASINRISSCWCPQDEQQSRRSPAKTPVFDCWSTADAASCPGPCCAYQVQEYTTSDSNCVTTWILNIMMHTVQ